jgi:hypothetical protein
MKLHVFISAKIFIQGDHFLRLGLQIKMVEGTFVVLTTH